MKIEMSDKEVPQSKCFFWKKWGIKFSWQKRGGVLHIEDLNPESSRFGETVSPRDYLSQVSAWYFGHST